MPTYTNSVEVNVSVPTAYNQWTQFETFPQFMEGIEEVKQVTDRLLHWRAEIMGQEQAWDAEITEQLPDERIAWTSKSGAHHAGVVTFHRINDTTTRVTLQIDYDPQGFIENVGAALGIVENRMAGDMQRFKDFIERRGEETGAWRGTIAQDY